jgi:WD40 repeat protein
MARLRRSHKALQTLLTVLLLFLVVSACDSSPSASNPRLIRRISFQSPFPNTVVWSPDSSKIAVGSTLAPVRIWDSGSGRLVTKLDVGAGANGISWSPDGVFVAVAAMQPSNRFQVWRLNDTQPIVRTEVGSGATDVYWSPDGKRLAVIAGGHTGATEDKADIVEDAAIHLYDSLTWTPTVTLSLTTTLGYMDFITAGSWSSDGSQFVFTSTTGDLAETHLIVWDVSDNEAATLGDPITGYGADVRWSPDGTMVAVTSGSEIALIDASSGQVARRLDSGSKTVSIGWSPDSKRLAGAGQSGTIKVWETNSGALLMALDQGDMLTSMAWSPDGNYLASTSSSDALWIWDAR